LKIKGLWLAAGILGVSGAILKRVAEAGADAVITKSLGMIPREGYPTPIIASFDNSLINAVGLTNPGIHNFIGEIKIAKEGQKPVIVSIFGSDEEEFAKIAKIAENAGADAIELNVSCPHAKVSQIGQSAELTYEVTKAVKSKIQIPVIVKLTPNVTDIVEIAQAAEEAGADAITAINTIKAIAIDIYLKKPILGNKFGGLSGPAIFPIALRNVYDIYENINIPIIGSGGVTDWKTAIAMHLAGASAIQIGTALLDGLDIFERIKSGIKEYLSKEGFRDVSEIVGLAHKK